MSETLEAHALPYEAGENWDEAFEEGRPRPGYETLMTRLAQADLPALRGRLAERLAQRGVSFGPSSGPQEFVVDPVPRIIGAGEWRRVSAGLVQRARALSAFVADVYADREIVEAGIVPARVVESAGHFEPWMVGRPAAPLAFVAGLDLVRGADGVLRVLEDNFRTPSGMAYAAAAREELDPQLPLRAPPRANPVAAFDLLATTLRRAAPEGVADPFVVLLSDGPSNSAWWEHREIGRRTGIPIVTRDDLLIRRGRVHAALQGTRTRPVDVVYRRTEEDRLCDPEGRSTWIADALLPAVRAGTLTVVNALGSGVADDKLAHAYVEEMVRFYLSEEPLIESVPTFDLGDAATRATVMPRLDELVVKPRGSLGGHGVTVCRQASTEDRRRIETLIEECPEDWIAQDTVTLSTHPTVCDGRLEPRHVDLRPYVIGAGDETCVAPVALTRVAFDAGCLVVNSSQNGGAKDTWLPA